MKVYLDLKPTQDGSAQRGVGIATRLLRNALTQFPGITLVDNIADADVVHYPYFDLFFHTLPWRQPKPVVVTIHDVIPLRLPQFTPVGLRGWWQHWMQRWSLSRVKKIVTDSQASKKDITKYLRVSATKITVVPLAANPDLRIKVIGVDLARNLVDQLVRDQSHQELPAKYILYVGDINGNKNIPQLIKALKYLPEDLHLVCVNPHFIPSAIPEWSAIQAQVKISEVGSRVHFVTKLIGAAATQTLAALYHAAVCTVQPSLWEGFGLPVLEAMQCYSPVVCTRFGSLPEVAGKFAEFASDGTAYELAQPIKRVVAWSSQKRLHRVQAAAKWAVGFRWTTTAQLLYTVYQQALVKKMQRTK